MDTTLTGPNGIRLVLTTGRMPQVQSGLGETPLWEVLLYNSVAGQQLTIEQRAWLYTQESAAVQSIYDGAGRMVAGVDARGAPTPD